jgi:MFS transporter, AAHS family, 4-hydroxybenzoate transporter
LERRFTEARTSGLVDVTLRYQTPGFLETPARAYGADKAPVKQNHRARRAGSHRRCGAVLAALLIEKFGSRGTMVITALLAIGGALGLSALAFTPANVDNMMVLLGITGGAINAVQTTLYALSAHIYPTAMRATGVGAAATIGRIGAITSSFLGVIGGRSTYFLFTAVAMGCVTAALIFIQRHVTGSRSKAGT